MSTNPVSLETTSDTAGTLLHSDTTPLIENLRTMMNHCSDEMKFLDAANLAHAIRTIERLEKELANAQRPWSVMLSSENPADPFVFYTTEIIDTGHSDRILNVRSNLVTELRRELNALKAGGSPSLSDVVTKDSGQRQDSTEVAAGRDGGPAFPSAPIASATDDRSEQRDGMSLRDWFAGQALIGFLSHPDTKMDPDDFAELTDFMRTGPFKIADAMLGARTRKGANKVSNVVTQSPEQAEAEDEAAWIKRWHAIGDNRDHDKAKQDFLAGRRSRGGGDS